MAIIIMKKTGQSTIELTLVFGALFLLLLGIVRIMGWFNEDMASRQEAFFNSRVAAGRRATAGVGIGYTTAPLSLY